MYMYNRKYDLKFYDIDFSLFIGVGVRNFVEKKKN